MSGRDAFEDEMGFLRRISAEDGERLLSNPGQNGGEATELQEVAAFVRALPAAVSTQPDPGIEGILVDRLAATAHAATREAHATATSEVPVAGPGWVHGRRRLVLASVAVAIALVPASLAGLAFAGVTLPEPARAAFERIGIELPNQSEADDGEPAGTGGDNGGGAQSKPDQRAEPNGDGDSDSATSPGGDHSGQEVGPSGQQGSGQGNGDGGQAGQSQGGGPESTPPGHGATPPGQGGVPPGQGGPPPGHEGAPPGQSGVPPGQAKPKS